MIHQMCQVLRKKLFVFRYELNGIVHERFWRFFNPKTPNAEVLAKCILEQVNVVLSGDSDKPVSYTHLVVHYL